MNQASMCSLEAEKHYAEIAKKKILAGVAMADDNPPETFPEGAKVSDRESRAKAARDFGTNPHYVSDAKKIS